jgi:hypothetical protein
MLKFNKGRQRGDGRTYRKALQMCSMASSGKHVLFIAGNTHELRQMEGRVAQHLPPDTARGAFGFKFLGGGTVHFRLAGSDLRGTRYTHVVEDELLGMSWREIEQHQLYMAELNIRRAPTV